MTPRHRLPRLAAAAALTLTLGLGACGGDGTGEGDGASANGAADESEQTGGDQSTGSGSGQATSADKVAIVDFAYKPDPVKVKAGTEVTWTNQDTAAHTVTADDKSFDSKNMDKDATFKHRFDTAGTFEYFCAIHNYMTGSVVVE
ncbi:MAG: cupredoxin family copper-binding protein [Actinomycetota bacterium]|nr:cupredoxin family copper-binding protein [Actinomycetota bacterium]